MAKTLCKIITLIALLYVQQLAAQTPTLRNFTNEDYGGGTQNWAIDFLADGRVLFANNDGMLVADGARWNLYRVANYTNVHDAINDKTTNRTYVGAAEELGYFQGDTFSARLVYHSMVEKIPAHERPFADVWHVCINKDRVYFSTKEKVFIFNDDNYLAALKPNSEITDMNVVMGQVFVATKGGTYKIDDQKLSPLPQSDILVGRYINSILLFNNSVLFVDEGGNLFVYDGHSTIPLNLNTPALLMGNRVFSAATDGKYIALGTVEDGVVLLDTQSSQVFYFNMFSGLKNNTVLSLKFDDQNNLWLGLDNGIAYVMLDSPYRSLLVFSNNRGTGYASLRHNNLLYLGTNQGLFYVPYPLVPSPTPANPQPVSGVKMQVWSVTEIDGVVLCGTNTGAYVINGNVAQQIQGLKGTWKMIPLKGYPDMVLAADYDGYAVLQRSATGYVMKNRVAGFDISTSGIEQDDDGAIMVSHWLKGIYRFYLSTDLMRVTSVQYFHEGNGLPTDDSNIISKIDDKVYVSSTGGVFYHYDKASKQLVEDSIVSAIFNSFGQALRIVQTPSGDLWGYKANYLALAHKQDNGKYQVDTLGYQNMINRLQTGLGHLGFLDSLHTIFNCDAGFYVVSHNRLNTKNSHKVMIKAITCVNEPDSFLYFRQPGDKEETIEVPHQQNSLRILAALPEFREQNACTFSFFLEGYDRQWSTPELTHFKDYTGLDKGTYTIHVRAHNSVTGQESETQLEIRILPAWYQTWWAYIIYLVLLAVAVKMAMKFLEQLSQKKLKREMAEYERQVREQENVLKAQQAQLALNQQVQEKEIMRVKAQQIEVELKHKSSELGDSTMNLVRKNDMLNAIDQAMEELLTNVRHDEPKSTITKGISDIRRQIRQHMSDDDNWDKFQENFNIVYDNFMSNLMEQHPDLNKTDLRLCAYLRMGLSSKEMASLMNTSVRSIETARYRLRKKLQLDSGDNLVDYLLSIMKQ